MKRILVFVIAVLFLVGAASVKEAQAATTYNQQESYMTYEEALKSITGNENFDFSALDGYTIESYVILYNKNEGNYFFCAVDTSVSIIYMYMSPHLYMNIGTSGRVNLKFNHAGFSSSVSTTKDFKIANYSGDDYIYFLYANFPFKVYDKTTYTYDFKQFQSAYYYPSYTGNTDVQITPTPGPTLIATPTPGPTLTATPTPTPEPTPTVTPTPAFPPTGTVQIQVNGTSVGADYEIGGSLSGSFYLMLYASDTMDGEYSFCVNSDYYSKVGTGKYTFHNLSPGYYFYVDLVLDDGTVIATSSTEYVMKDDAEIDLDIAEADGIITSTYTLSGGQSINAAVYLQKSVFGGTWPTISSNSSAVAGTDVLYCDAQDGYLYRLYVEYVCRNEDGLDVSGTAVSELFHYVAPTTTPTPTLIPDPELMDHTADFSFIVRIVMLLMQDFPLNLFLVAVFICAGLVIFDETKRGLKKK